MKKISMMIMVLVLLSGCQASSETNQDHLDLLQGQIDQLTGELDIAKAKENQYIEDLEFLEEAMATLKSEAMTNENFQGEMEALRERLEALQRQLAEEPSLMTTALILVDLIEDKDYKGLAAYVDTSLGLSFSPYGYIDEATSLTFTPGQVALLMSDETIYTWGSFDGTGDPIDMTYHQYHERFVYDQAFVSAQLIGQNTFVNAPYDNLSVIYPDAQFVEFHFKGFDPEFEGLDWVSLRLVFKFLEGEWKLIHIIHDQWTI